MPSFVIFDTLTLSPEHQSARMSKITNDGLTRSGTWCFIAVPVWQKWASVTPSGDMIVDIVSKAKVLSKYFAYIFTLQLMMAICRFNRRADDDVCIDETVFFSATDIVKQSLV